MAVKDSNQDSENALHFDIYRTIVLGHYIKHWGMPEFRRIVRNLTDQSKIEIFTFPSESDQHVYRIATVGLAEQKKPDGSKENHEFFMTLPSDLGGGEMDDVINYLADLSAHSVKNFKKSELPIVMGESKLAPCKWRTKAILIDEPRGENEDFFQISINKFIEVQFYWVIPIHETECKFILKNGIDAFDKLEQESDFSIADIARPSLTDQ